MFELLFSCVIAVSSSTAMYLIKPISRSKEIVLNKAIDTSNNPVNFKEFLDVPKNYSISRQYHYETAFINLLLKLTTIISIFVICSTIYLILTSTPEEAKADLNYSYSKYIITAAVFNILFTLGCHFLARNIDDKTV
ncbi:hypothetical protein IMCC3317_18250 [Kordia antarctica]|uniref:Uncharacterized protein n=1 Tax=Kordia antarctica TaxID=1218801 RepID=A0A7L4ZIJ7_9FLAO|nr:hypothetical protein [Kordia antarctica]QHI36462.1 hypothetical protein IMCC3317_18250 [Kordia antarctica]